MNRTRINGTRINGPAHPSALVPYGYQFNNPTDTITVTPGSATGGLNQFTIVLWYKLAPGTIEGLASAGNYCIISQWGSGTDAAFVLYVNTSPSPPVLELVLNNAGAGYRTATDVLVEDNNYHSLIVQFGAPGNYEIWNDRQSYAHTQFGVVSLINSSTQPIHIGYNPAVGPPIPGMTIGGRITLYGNYNGTGAGSVVLTGMNPPGGTGGGTALPGSDIDLLVQGYPPDVIRWQHAPPSRSVNQAGPLEILVFGGASTFNGQLGLMSATVSGPTLVTGKTLFDPYIYNFGFENGRTTAHIPGSNRITGGWANSRLAAPYNVALTFTDSDPNPPGHDTWSPLTPTLLATTGTVTSDLTVSGTQSPGPQSVTISNTQNLLPQTLGYTITSTSLVQLATGYPRIDDTGSIIWVKFVKVSDGSAVCLTDWDDTVSASVTITNLSGSRTIPVEYFAWGGTLGEGWFPSTRVWTGVVDDVLGGGGGFSTPAGSWSQPALATPSVIPSDVADRYFAVYNQFLVSNTPSAHAAYQWTVPYYGDPTTTTGCFGNQYQLYGLYRDNFPGLINGASSGGPYCPGNPYLSGGNPTTHAQTSISGDGGTTFQVTAVNQRLTGATGNDALSDDNEQLYRWVKIGTPFAAAQATVTMDLTNPAGTDWLIADAYRLVFIPTAIQPADTLVFNANDSVFTCGTGANFTSGYSPGTPLDTTGPITAQAVTHLTLDQIAPFDASRGHKLSGGHNPTYPNWTSPGVTYANRLRVGWANGSSKLWHAGASSTAGNFDTDQYGQLTRLDAGKSVYVLITTNNFVYPSNQNNGVDGWDALILPPHGSYPNYRITLLWSNAWTGTITLTNGDYSGPVLGTPIGVTPATSGSTGVNYDFTYDQPKNGFTIGLNITSSDGTFPTRLRAFDALTPAGTTTETHPVELARFRDGKGPIRPNDVFHINAPTQAHQNDYPPDGGPTVEGPQYANWTVNEYAVTEFAPVDFSVSDNDGIVSYWPAGTVGAPPGASATNSVFKFTLQSGSPALYPGQRVSFASVDNNATDLAHLNRYESNGGTGGMGGTLGIGFPILSGGAGYIFSVPSTNAKLAANTYVMSMGTNDTYGSSDNPPTAANPYTVAGIIAVVINSSNEPTFESQVRVAAEAGVPIIFPIAVAEAFNNATLTWKTQTVLTSTSQGMPIYPELGNEPFGESGSEDSGVLCQLIVRGILAAGNQSVNLGYGYLAGYAFHQIYQIIQAWDTAHGTHRINDFCPCLNTNGFSTDDQYQGLLDAGSSPLLGGPPFSATAEFSQLVVMVAGYVNNDLNNNYNLGSYTVGPMGGAITSTCDQLPPVALPRLFAYHFQLAAAGQQAYVEAVIASARSHGFTGATTGCYEWAIQQLKPYTAHGSNSSDATQSDRNLYFNDLATNHLSAVIDPAMYRVTLSFLQNYLEPVFANTYYQVGGGGVPQYGGFSCFYSTDGTNFLNQGSGWQIYTSMAMQDGNGTQTDTNPGHLASIYSQVGGAIAAFNALSPAPAGGPFPFYIDTACLAAGLQTLGL